VRTADLPRRTAPSGSLSVAGHAPRHSPFPAAFRYPQLYEQRGLTERATEDALPLSGAHGVQIPSQVYSHRRVADAFPHRPGPRAVRLRILTDRFHRLLRRIESSCDGISMGETEDCDDSASGLRSLRWSALLKKRAILPWASPLSGLRTRFCRASLWSFSPPRSSAPGPGDQFHR